MTERGPYRLRYRSDAEIDASVMKLTIDRCRVTFVKIHGYSPGRLEIVEDAAERRITITDPASGAWAVYDASRYRIRCIAGQAGCWQPADAQAHLAVVANQLTQNASETLRRHDPSKETIDRPQTGGRLYAPAAALSVYGTLVKFRCATREPCEAGGPGTYRITQLGRDVGLYLSRRWAALEKRLARGASDVGGGEKPSGERGDPPLTPPARRTIYALVFDDGTAYVGQTNDPDYRIAQSRRFWPGCPDPALLVLQELTHVGAAEMEAWRNKARDAGLGIRSGTRGGDGPVQLHGTSPKGSIAAKALEIGRTLAWPDVDAGTPRVPLRQRPQPLRRAFPIDETTPTTEPVHEDSPDATTDARGIEPTDAPVTRDAPPEHPPSATPERNPMPVAPPASAAEAPMAEFIARDLADRMIAMADAGLENGNMELVETAMGRLLHVRYGEEAGPAPAGWATLTERDAEAVLDQVEATPLGWTMLRAIARSRTTGSMAAALTERWHATDDGRATGGRPARRSMARRIAAMAARLAGAVT